MKSSFALIAVGLFFISFSVPADQPHEPKEPSPGLAAIQQWLVELDRGDYKRCWDEGGKILHDAVPSDQWVKNGSSAFGKCTNRKLIELREHNRFRLADGTPIDGQFLEVLFDTNFERQSGVSERVSAMKEADRTWRVFAYDAEVNKH